MGDVTVSRGPYRTGIRRRREIVEAASRVFARYGYAGGSLRQIASDVGVTTAALARHFDNKYGLLQAVLVKWEEENDHWFADAAGVEYFRRLPRLVEFHVSEPGLIELLLTLATEATDPQHPARSWAVQRYDRVINLGIGYLREARELGEIGDMTDEQIEMEARAVFALMDGIQLQWLLNPSLPVADIFRRQLDLILEGWARGAKSRRRRVPSGLTAPGSPGEHSLAGGTAMVPSAPAEKVKKVKKAKKARKVKEQETGASAARA